MKFTDMEINILSRLAMLKISGNVGVRFSEAEKLLEDYASIVAKAIRKDCRKNKIAKSLLEWAECELGIKNNVCTKHIKNGSRTNQET